MKPLQSFGVIAFKKTTAVRCTLQRIADWSAVSGVPVLFHHQLHGRAPENAILAHDEQDLISKSDALISVGGDGTFLSVAHLCSFCRPVIGVNLGGIGFLTDIGPDHLEANLSRISKGECRIISRRVLKGTLLRNGETIRTFNALNDIFINRTGKPKLATISAWFGDDFLNDFRCDGLIVATPAGSTAYSLAAGGPILDPDVHAYLLTPICPHSLSERPLVLPATQTIRVMIGHKNPDLLISADGLWSMKLEPGDEIHICYDDNRATLIQLAETSFFESLRTKLSWGKSSIGRTDGDEHDS